MTPRKILSPRYRRWLSLLSLALLCCTTSLMAQYSDPFEVEETLLNELDAMGGGMRSYYNAQLQLMKRDFSGYREDMQYIEAISKPGRREQVEALQSIPKTSKRYTDALWTLANMSKQAGNKVKFLSELREVLKKKMEAGGSRGKLRKAEEQQLHRLGMMMLDAMIETGEKVPTELVNDLVEDTRGRIFWTAKVKLLQAEKMKEAGGKPVPVDPKKPAPKPDPKADPKKAPPPLLDYQQAAEEALKLLTESELPWKRDYWGVMAAVEAAHAYLILDRPAKALGSLKDVWNTGILREFENEIKRSGGNVSAVSPMAGANFYLAQIREREAEALSKNAAKREEMKSKMEQALNLYWKVRSEYDESAFVRDAITRFEDLRKKIKQVFNVDIEPPKESPKKIMEVAMAFYRDDKLKEAYTKFVEAARRDLRGSNAPDCLFYATACLYKQQPPRYLEALALADFMGDIAPANPKTHDMIYKTAGLAWNHGNEVKDEKSKAVYQQASMRMFMRLFQLAPNHPGAAAAAFRMAEAKWKDADEARKRKDGIKKGASQKEIDEAIRSMQQAYLDAVPFYEVLTRNYGTTAYGILSFYKLGWIYYIAEKPDQATENFLEYCSLESEDKVQKLRAKFIAADQLYRTEQIDEALKNFAELLAWIDHGAYPKKDAQVANTRRSALAMLPWCYDKQAAEFFEKALNYEEDAQLIDGRIKQFREDAAKARGEIKETPEDEPEKEPEIETVPDGGKPEGADRDAEKDGVDDIDDAGNDGAGDDDDADAGDDGAGDDDDDGDDEDNGGGAADQGPKLPGDFRLNYLTFIEVQVNMVKDLEKETEFIAAGDSGVYLKQADDLVTGLKGKGLEVSRLNDETYLWRQAPLACYREGKLLGIYDFDKKMFVAADAGQAPQEFKLPEKNIPSKLVEELETKRLSLQAEAMRAEAKKLKAEGQKIQNQALDGLKLFLKDYPTDDVYAAGSLLKIGVIYLTRRDYEEASKWLDRLWKEFPQSAAAQNAEFVLLQVYIETNQLDKAKAIATKLKAGLTDLPFGNLAFVAFKLFEVNERGETACIQSDLALAGLSELLRRADTKNPDQARATRLKEKAMLRQAEALMIGKSYESVIKKCDELLKLNAKTPYFFDLWILKGQAYRELKNYEESLRQFDKILTLIDKRKFKYDYYRAVVESGITLRAQEKDKQALQRALFRFQQVIEFADAGDDQQLELLIQRAYVGFVQCSAVLGQSQQASNYRSKFQQLYPNSPFRGDLATLPAAQF